MAALQAVLYVVENMQAGRRLPNKEWSGLQPGRARHSLHSSHRAAHCSQSQLAVPLLSTVQSSSAGWEDRPGQPPSGSATPALQAAGLPDAEGCWHCAGRDELARAGATMAEVLAHRPPASDPNLQRELASIHRYLRLGVVQLAAVAVQTLSILMLASA